MIELPEPVRRYFDGTNAHDPDTPAPRASQTMRSFATSGTSIARRRRRPRMDARDAITQVLEHTVQVLVVGRDRRRRDRHPGRVSGNFPGKPDSSCGTRSSSPEERSRGSRSFLS